MRSEPVVLLHGVGSSFEHGWRTAGWVDLLADSGRAVVPIDILGHGKAEAPHDPAAYADLDATVEASFPDEPVDAIGFSLGAQLLLRIAARRPERLGRLVLIGVGANVFRGDDASALADAFDSYGSLAAPSVAPLRPHQQGHEPEDLTARLFVQLASSAGNDPLAIAACLRRPSEPFSAADAARVSCPTLVIIGDRDFAGPADPLIAALPHAELTVLRGVDHFRATSEFACIDAALEFIDAAP